MKKLILCALIAVTTIATGCASLPEGHTTDINEVAKKSLIGGGFGCAVGALTGVLTGGKDNVAKGCVAGAAVGAISAGVAERNRQIEEANQLAAAARDKGMTATVHTVDEAIPGEAKPVQTLKGLTIDLPADVTGKDVTEVIQRAARMSDASKTPVTITVKGNKAQRNQVVGVLRLTLKAGTQTTVKEAESKAPALHLAPIPDVEG